MNSNTWQRKPIDKLAKIIVSPVDKKSQVNEKDVYLCNYRDVYYNRLITSDIKFMKATASDSEIGKFILKKGDVVITKDSEDPKDIAVPSVIVENIKNLVCGYHLAILRPSKNTDSIFIAYAITHPRIRYDFYRYANGITRFGLTNDTYNKVKIFTPLLPEQKAIASLLSVWDEAIEKTERLIAAKEKYKKRLVDLIVSQKNDYKEYFLFELLNLVQRPIPKPEKSYLALGIRSHCKGTFIRKVEDPSGVMMDELYQVKENDLIINITFAWEGAIALVKKTNEGALVSHRFPTYTFKENIVNPIYFYHLISKKKYIHQLGTISPGGAGRNRVLNKKDFLKLKVHLPSQEEQNKFANIFNAYQKEINLLTDILLAYKNQKWGLMQKLLTSKWRVKVNEGKKDE